MTRETWRALLVMLITQAAVVMAAYTAPVLGKQISGNLALPAVLVGYYTSIVFAGAMAASLFSGALIHVFGPVRVSQGTVLLAALGLALLATGNGLAVALSAVLIGLAYAPGNPASSQLLIRTTPPQRRNAVFSLKQTAVPLGIAAAGVILPLLIQVMPWQTAILAVIAAFILIILLAEVWRAALDEPQPGEPPRLSAFAPFRIVLGSPPLRRLSLVSLSFASVQFGFSAIFVTFMQETQGLSTAAAGSLLSTAMVLSVVSRIVLGASADRFGGRRMLFMMAALMILAGLTLITASAGSMLIAALAGVVLGAAAFSWNGVYLAEVAQASPSGAVASATAGTMFFVFLGGFVGPALLAATISASGRYEAGLAVLSAMAAIGAALLLLPERLFAVTAEAVAETSE